jgi:uncharacterized GH25 family protein
MRPILILVALVVVAGLLVGTLFLVGQDSKSPALSQGASAPDVPATTASTKGTSTLDAPEQDALTRAQAPAPSAPSAAPAEVSAAKLPSSGAGVRGRVLDENGHPIAGATVYATASGDMADLPLDEIDPRMMNWVKRGEAKSDAQGNFEVATEAQGVVRLGVRAAGFAPLDVERPISGEQRQVGEVRLETGVVLEGRVVDSASRPVAGAEVRRRKIPSGAMGPMVMMAGRNGPVLSKTDAQGRFHVDQMASGPWSLLVTHEEYPDKIESGESERAGEQISNLLVQVEDGYDIQGRVRGADAQALAKLGVRASARGGESGDGGLGVSFGFANVRKGKINADGTFRVAGLKKDTTYRLTLRPDDQDGFGMVRGGPRGKNVEAKSGDRNVELVYEAGPALTFQVVDGESGAPVTELVVHAGGRFPMPLRGADQKTQRHFPEGRVRYPDVPSLGGGTSTIQLKLEAQGFQPFERKDIKPAEGGDTDLGVIRLERSKVVHFSVLAALDNKPIEGAQVELERLQDDEDGPMRFFSLDEDETGFVGQGSAQRAKTDAKGKATVTSLPGERARVRVRHKGYAPYVGEAFMLPTVEDHDVVVRLHSGGTVVVAVVDSNGKPLPGVGVEHKTPEDQPDMVRLSTQDDLTDADGHATFEHLTQGTHRFKLSGSSGGVRLSGASGVRASFRSARLGGGAMPMPEEEGWAEVTVSEGARETLTLVAPERCSITGRISESGKPLSGATVRLVEHGESDDMGGMFGNELSAQTDGGGRFTITNVPAAEYDVVVSHPTRAMDWTGEASLVTGETRFNADLPVAIVEGRISGADGEPLVGIRVRVQRAATENGPERDMMTMWVDGEGGDMMSFRGPGGGGSVTTDGDGRYRLRGVTPDVEVAVIASGKDVQRGESEPFKLTADQVKTGVDLTLEQGATIEVTVKRADGTPGLACLLRAQLDGAEEPSVKTEFTGPDGRARFQGLKPGRWKVTCQQIGMESGGNSAEIEPQVADIQAGTPKKLAFEVP